MKWIKSLRFDLIFFIPVWFPLLFLAVLDYPGKTGVFAALPLAIYLAYHALLRLPHFLITVPLIYARDRAGHGWFLYLAVPVAILAVYLIFPHSKILISFALIWGWFHIGMQNFGFQRLYLNLNRSRLGKNAVYPLIYGGFILSKILTVAGIESALRWLDAALAVLGLVWAYLKFVKYKERFNSADAFFLLAAVMLLDWPRMIGMHQLAYFYLFNLHHCLAYLGVSYVLSRNQASGTLAFKRMYLPVVLISTILVAALVCFDRKFLTVYISDDSGFHPLFLGLFVVHYYLDGVAWKVRDGHLSLNRFVH